MAVMVRLPQLGNTVESTILVRWHKAVGDSIAVGEPLCEVETDKTTMEVESSAAGTILKLLYSEGDVIPILVDIAAVGEPGEALPAPQPSAAQPAAAAQPEPQTQPTSVQPAAVPAPAADEARPGVSPRARKLAARSQIDAAALTGSGPGGRVIERDVQAAQASAPKLSPVARAMLAGGEFQLPQDAAQSGRRITSRDLTPAARPEPAPAAPAPAAPAPAASEGVEIVPLRGARRVIASRMLASLQTTAQLTMTSWADARALRALRTRMKTLPAELGLRDVTINDLLLYAVARTLPAFPALNTLLIDDAMHRHAAVHLSMAVDTERGLLVPVIRDAHTRTLPALAAEAHRLAAACQDGSIHPDALSGGTFTVTNLGSLGIESFTPVLNAPQVGILGVGTITPRPVETADGIDFIPQICLSLTINHQVVDGAPGARFLQALTRAVAQLDLSIITR
jgi:pyruvate dehydrogenase E2 component (dihydrolipoamide acetyltransferase)